MFQYQGKPPSGGKLSFRNQSSQETISAHTNSFAEDVDEQLPMITSSQRNDYFFDRDNVDNVMEDRQTEHEEDGSGEDRQFRLKDPDKKVSSEGSMLSRAESLLAVLAATQTVASEPFEDPLKERSDAMGHASAKIDVLVKWKRDGRVNVVKWEELDSYGEETPIVVASIRMWRAPQKQWWEGVILAHDFPTHEETSAKDEDFPLSELMEKQNAGLPKPITPISECTLAEQTVSNTALEDITKSVENVENVNSDLVFDQKCENLNCKQEVFSACTKCLALLCYDHTVVDLPCDSHTAGQNFVTVCSSEEIISPLQEITVDNNETSTHPESFIVDGSRKEDKRPSPKKLNKKIAAKENRNLGRSYKNPCTNRYIPARRVLSVRCDNDWCKKKVSVAINLLRSNGKVY
ncbi:hypothetical protein HOLleu_42113 [Holothuria leucospilota]|uniref:Uncharacterized protein n=1 Tax=Holothuria leucospilota TaxID=206669 RepID=A0A9Q0YDA9_HOLLE|nr:hypothetical protein HOLleu_42113 [Holothuria leucospilota]